MNFARLYRFLISHHAKRQLHCLCALSTIYITITNAWYQWNRCELGQAIFNDTNYNKENVIIREIYDQSNFKLQNFFEEFILQCRTTSRDWQLCFVHVNYDNVPGIMHDNVIVNALSIAHLVKAWHLLWNVMKNVKVLNLILTNNHIGHSISRALILTFLNYSVARPGGLVGFDFG